MSKLTLRGQNLLSSKIESQRPYNESQLFSQFPKIQFSELSLPSTDQTANFRGKKLTLRGSEGTHGDPNINPKMPTIEYRGLKINSQITEATPRGLNSIQRPTSILRTLKSTPRCQIEPLEVQNSLPEPKSTPRVPKIWWGIKIDFQRLKVGSQRLKVYSQKPKTDRTSQKIDSTMACGQMHPFPMSSSRFSVRIVMRGHEVSLSLI